MIEHLPLPGAELLYWRDIGLGDGAGDLLARLIGETPWQQESIRLWGRSYPQPRLTAWYGDPGRSYRYSGLALTPLPWSTLLAGLRARVEAAAGQRFNSVLLNQYRDGRDGMGLHSDDEPELGPCPVIASLSLGAARALVFKSRGDRTAMPVRHVLAPGSLLVMKGDTQRNWKHGVARQRAVVAPRVNLTFRTILPELCRPAGKRANACAAPATRSAASP